MRITYDERVDILVVSLGDLRESPGAEEVAPGVYLDIADDGRVLGLEILDASKKYPREVLSQHPAHHDEPIALAEAARTLGVTPQALQKAIVRGRLEGKKVGKTWTTTIAALTRYTNSRAHEGPGSRETISIDVSPVGPARQRTSKTERRNLVTTGAKGSNVPARGMADAARSSGKKGAHAKKVKSGAAPAPVAPGRANSLTRSRPAGGAASTPAGRDARGPRTAAPAAGRNRRGQPV